MVSMYYPLLALSTCLFAVVHADVTIYGLFGQTTADPLQTDGGVATTSYQTTPGPPSYTGLAAYNPVFMYPPEISNPAPPNQFAIGLPTDQNLMNALSIKQQGNFFGFSIEMSVATQVSEYRLASRVRSVWNV